MLTTRPPPRPKTGLFKASKLFFHRTKRVLLFMRNHYCHLGLMESHRCLSVFQWLQKNWNWVWLRWKNYHHLQNSIIFNRHWKILMATRACQSQFFPKVFDAGQPTIERVEKEQQHVQHQQQHGNIKNRNNKYNNHKMCNSNINQTAVPNWKHQESILRN